LREPGWIETLRQPAEHHLAIRDRDGQGRTPPLDLDGGDAQRGALSVMFDGPRVNSTYDPMRKQGAILLGNGGDNSVGSQAPSMKAR